MRDDGPMRRRVGYAVAWLVAVVAAVTVGVLTVTAVGASLTGRGPLGDEVIRGIQPVETEVPESVLEAVPDESLETRVFTEEFGSIEVGCRGPYAVGVAITPDRAAGWRVVSYDGGPDEDVEAVLVRGGHTAEIEIFCNRGVPTVAELDLYDAEEPDDRDD